MFNENNDIFITRYEIEYKLVSGDDLIKLYEILVLVAKEYNDKEIENKRKEYLEPEKYYTPYIPTYSIEISENEKISGSEIDKLEDFLKRRKAPIKSIWFDFSARNKSVSIRTNSSSIYSNYYEIKGEEDWVAVVKGRLNKIIDDMSSLPLFIVAITKYDTIAYFLFALIAYFLLGFIIIKFQLKVDSSVLPWLGASWILLMLLFYSKVYSHITSMVEYALNNKYIDPKIKIRKNITNILTGLITLFSIIEIISWL